jgi:chemotaxis methyl-accepting protein methylase
MNKQFQISCVTHPKRSTHLFYQVKRKNHPLIDPENILSFGCSTGDELIDLMEVFPNTKLILGVDINTKALSIAEKKTQRHREKITVFSSYVFEMFPKKSNLFQLITCCNVLCHFPETPDYGPFDLETFDMVVRQLWEMLAIGGSLLVTGSNWSILHFFETFIPLPTWSKRKINPSSGFVPVYHRKSGVLIPKESASCWLISKNQ